jgi:uncharacterized protein (TIGR02001 family)
MKKAFILLSMCTAIASNAFAETPANADSKGSQAIKEAAVTNPNYPWLNNINANVSFVTNYIFRGISQSRNLPAIQGGLTYNTPFNLYLNVWASNVKFSGTDATVEMDGIIGYANTYGDNIAYDINVARYFYPSERTLEYNELNALLNIYFLQFGISYSANVYNVHKRGTYYNGGINYDVPSKYLFGLCNVNFQALFGHYDLPIEAGNSYNDYLVGLSKTFDHYTLGVTWTSTNGRQKSSPIDGSTITAMVSADF